jgi:tetratricopeptide (TPR) repeat protein
MLALTVGAVLMGGLQFNSTLQIIDADTEDIYVVFTPFPESEIGFNVGGILNAHYFPGIKYYQAGRYRRAMLDLNYFIARPTYTNGNPKQANYLSTAHYARGMIYLHHTTGLGGLSLARQDFEAAIMLNKNNYLAYLELSRVFSTGGLKSQADSILKALLDLNPDDKQIVEDARRELNSITPTPQVQPPSTGQQSIDHVPR